MTKQAVSLIPATKLGKWSIGLMVVMLLLFFAGASLTDSLYAAVPAGNTIIEDLSGRPMLALSMLAGMLTGVAVFITGLLAVAKQKERSLMVYLSCLIGALLLVQLVGEILFSH